MKPLNFLLILLSLSGCRKDDPVPVVNNPNPVFKVSGYVDATPVLMEAGNNYMSARPEYISYYNADQYCGSIEKRILPFGSFSVIFHAVSLAKNDTSLIDETLYVGRKIPFYDLADSIVAGANVGKATVSLYMDGKIFSSMYAANDTSQYILIQQVENYPTYTPAFARQTRVKKVTFSFINCRVSTYGHSDSLDLKNMQATMAIGRL